MGRLRVIIVARDPGTELEEGLGVVLAQDDRDFEAVVVDDASREPLAPRVPADPRVRVMRHDEPAGDQAILRALAEDGWEPDDIVVPLAQGHRLASPSTLGLIRVAFADPECKLLYAPHLGSDGRARGAFPAASQAEHAKAGPSLAGESTLCFRAALYAQARAAGDDGAPGLEELWHAAALAGTRFRDDALTVQASAPASPPRVVAAAPANGSPPPLISCLMVTRDRLALAMRAMRCFADQTYPARELVVVSEGDDWYRAALVRYADAHQIANVRVLPARPGLTLGALRNLTLDEAVGPVVCQWDDDDCSHPDRLAAQSAAMEAEGAAACFLTDHLQYLEDEGLLFWIDWTMNGQITDEWQLFPGTVMMRRDERFRYPEEGPYSRRGEDSVLVEHLNRSVPIARIAGMGHLYLYHYHGGNTFPREHHRRITSCAGPIDRVRAMADDIRRAVDYYPVPKPIPVVGAEGPAFVAG